MLCWRSTGDTIGPRPCPLPAPPPRSRPPAATAPARAGPSPPKARPAPRATRSSTASPPCTTSCSRTRCPTELEELTARLIAETGAVSEIEARLARRLAIAFWKGERAERIEVALFDAAPDDPHDGFRWEEADPLTTFDLKRFNAVRGYQAQQGREISRCLKELRLLRKDALAQDMEQPEDLVPHERNYTNELSPGTDEPESAWEKEPEPHAAGQRRRGGRLGSSGSAPDDERTKRTRRARPPRRAGPARPPGADLRHGTGAGPARVACRPRDTGCSRACRCSTAGAGRGGIRWPGARPRLAEPAAAAIDGRGSRQPARRRA